MFLMMVMVVDYLPNSEAKCPADLFLLRLTSDISANTKDSAPQPITISHQEEPRIFSL